MPGASSVDLPAAASCALAGAHTGGESDVTTRRWVGRVTGGRGQGRLLGWSIDDHRCRRLKEKQ
jgi:hypothetical protein